MLLFTPMEAHEPATYVPFVASLFAFERFFRASCAFLLFSSLPNQVAMHVFCNALPYEKETDHGNLGYILFIALRLMVAVSSLSSSNAVSPERKKMPGMVDGTVRLSA